LHNGDLSVWTAIVNFSLNTSIDEDLNNEEFSKVKQYPNPANDEVYFSFKLRSESLVSLSIYDLQGKLLAEPVQNVTYPVGKHIIPFQFKENGFEKGVYYYRLTLGDKIKTDKIIFK